MPKHPGTGVSKVTQRLTDRTIERLRIPKREPKIRWDALATGLGVKVMATGKRLFVLQVKRPGNAFQSKLTLGSYPALSLAEARVKAGRWRAMIAQGLDPKQVEAREARATVRAERLKQAHTFEAVAEAYIENHLAKLRRGKDDAREIRKNLIPKLGHLPIAEIARFDIVETIKPIAKRAPYVAHICLNHIKRVYSWAIEQDCYGIEQSPADRTKPRVLIGEKRARTRVLNDAELRAFWKASRQLGYPFAGLYQLIALTGCRIGEASGARWREFDLAERTWVIPETRFKSGQQHLVPLSEDAMAVLEALPRWNGGDYLFSTKSGVRPINGFSKTKSRVNSLIAVELGGAPEPFQIHDIRRTVRTRLSELRVPDHVGELVIGHGRRGLQRVYDLHTYEAEMREALERWAARLRSIVDPPPTSRKVLTRLPREAS
jgi:integrase